MSEQLKKQQVVEWIQSWKDLLQVLMWITIFINYILLIIPKP